MHTHIYTHKHRQAYTPIDRHIHTHTYRHTHRDIHIHPQTHQTHILTDTHTHTHSKMKFLKVICFLSIWLIICTPCTRKIYPENLEEIAMV